MELRLSSFFFHRKIENRFIKKKSKAIDVGIKYAISVFMNSQHPNSMMMMTTSTTTNQQCMQVTQPKRTSFTEICGR